MGRKLFFGIALLWSVLIGIVCLADGNSIPQTSLFKIPQKDKIAHFTFYFVFSILWFRYFRITKPKLKKLNLVVIIFAVASVMGMSIELMQYYFTSTRSAEWLDVLANCSGSLLGLLLSVALDRANRKI